MNIACTACSARYGVADAKLIGKRVKITCKRCGAVLIVDGNVSPPTVSVSTSIAPGPASGRASSSRAPEPAPAPRPPDPPFMIAFADGRQEEGDVAQIVRLHRAGQLSAQTLVWREGMDDWKNPWDIAEIAAAFRRMGYARPTPAPAPAARPREDEETTRVADSGPMQSALFDDDEATQVVDSSQFNEKPLPSFGSSPGTHAVSEDDDAATNIARSPLSSPEAVPAPAARRESARPQRRDSTRATQRESTRPRRDQSRGAEPARRRESRVEMQRGQDLFAQHSHAGSEEDQAAQAEQLMAAAAALQDAVDDGPRLTGARNENSVLFSLDALMQKELRGGAAPAAAPPRRSQRNDEALLVDTSSSLPGGGITPALSAPDFTAPITSPPPRFSPDPVVTDGVAAPPKKSKGVLVMVVLIALGGLGGIGFATGKLQPMLTKVGLMAPPAESATPEADPAGSTERPAASAAPETSAAPDASSAPAGSASADAPLAPPTGLAPTTATAPATGASPVAAAPAAGPTPRSREKEPAKEQDAPPAPAGFGAGAPFNAQAAKTVLVAAAANASSCKEPGGPTGSGRVSITFAASGRPTSVAVTGDLAGTSVGSCVARLFRGSRVPAFSGEPVTVSKTFSVQ